jgi:hypothetical protein
MRLLRDEEPEARERYMINCEKLMVAVAWKPDRFHGMEVLPKGHKSNPDCYRSSVLTNHSKIARIEQWIQSDGDYFE